MIPIDAYLDAIYKANRRQKSEKYPFKNRGDVKSFAEMVESTRRIEITNKQDNTVTVKLR